MTRTPADMPTAISRLLDRAIPLGALSSAQIWAWSIEYGLNFVGLVTEAQKHIQMTTHEGPLYDVLSDLIDDALREATVQQHYFEIPLPDGTKSGFIVPHMTFQGIQDMLFKERTPGIHGAQGVYNGYIYNNYINAIKETRQATGLGLREAKQVVDTIIGR